MRFELELFNEEEVEAEARMAFLPSEIYRAAAEASSEEGSLLFFLWQKSKDTPYFRCNPTRPIFSND